MKKSEFVRMLHDQLITSSNDLSLSLSKHFRIESQSCQDVNESLREWISRIRKIDRTQWSDLIRANEFVEFAASTKRVMTSLAVELSFGQKFKPDPRVGQTRQPNPWVRQLEPDETELVTYKFLGFEQKILFKPESWTEILVQPEDWIGRVVRHVRNPTLRPR